MGRGGALFELSAVEMRFGDTVAVRSVHLSVPEGRTTVLIGPSGCGKSTLLRLMLGLLTPTGGRLTFAGDRVDREARYRMGYVMQSGGLFPHLSARDNVALVADTLGWPAARIEARIAELVALVQLDRSLLDRPPSQLSGGQRQRVGLVRALMLDPPVLLADEPMAALDPMVRHTLQEELREIFRSLGKTVVLVTHDLAEAAFFADHIVLLRHGAVVQAGPLADLLERPADPFVTRFVNAQRGVHL
ncbi:MAG: osmoprotectant transport system ATP-binding protein [Myxococcota bacterium]